jgi:hypothetical protein
MLERCIALGTICAVNPGVVAHSRKGSPITFKKDDVIYREALEPNYKRYVDGEDLGRYSITWKRLYIDYDSKRDFFHRPKFPQLFESPKIMFRSVSGPNNSLIAVYDDGAFYTNDAIRHAVKWNEKIAQLQTVGGIQVEPRVEDYELRYIAALCSSRLISSYFSLFLAPGTLQGSYTSVYPEHIRALPIYRVNFEHSEPERQASLRELRSLLISGEESLLLEEVEALTTKGVSGSIHDLLTFMCQEMLDLNNEIYHESARFLDYLATQLKVSVRNGRTGIVALVGYTTIQNYLGDYQKGEPELPWAEMEYRLYQNRGRFAANWESVKGEVQAAYEQSLAKLRPIKQRLAETDALIDRIVYRLYGLTDEEIRLVEQPAYEQALSAARAQVAADKKLQRDPDAAAEAVAAKVLPAAQRLLQRVEHAAERASLDADLPGWQLYPEPVPTFLLTGEYNIQHQPDHLDFATSVMSYAKAVETMLFHRLFLPFRDEAGAPPAGAHNNFLRQFLSGERDKLTLGSMQIILASSKETALRAYAARRFYDAPTRLFGPGGVAALLADPAALALRNAAAHDQLITRAGAQSARAWAVSILEKL